jgi:hypothetical protein
VSSEVVAFPLGPLLRSTHLSDLRPPNLHFALSSRILPNPYHTKIHIYIDRGQRSRLSLSTSPSQALSPPPALATVNLGAQSRESAAEMQRILKDRGASLPQLTSSPQAAAPAPTAPSSYQGELLRELKRENQEIKRLREELEKSQRGQAVAPLLPSFSAPVPAPAPAPAPAPTAPVTRTPEPVTPTEKGGDSSFSALVSPGIWMLSVQIKINPNP